MIEKTSEKDVEREIEELLKAAEDYLWRAKASKSKDSQNFEVVLAQEYAAKAKDKTQHLMHMKEFYDSANRRADVVLDELSKLGITFARRKSHEEMKYEEGGIGGG